MFISSLVRSFDSSNGNKDFKRRTVLSSFVVAEWRSGKRLNDDRRPLTNSKWSMDFHFTWRDQTNSVCAFFFSPFFIPFEWISVCVACLGLCELFCSFSFFAACTFSWRVELFGWEPKISHIGKWSTHDPHALSHNTTWARWYYVCVCDEDMHCVWCDLGSHGDYISR